MRHFLIIVALALLASTPLSAFANSHQKPARPNIVFFLVDDLGWADVACYGSTFHETPNIDRLASQGVRFTNAYSVCHVCSPARGSILTGKYPARTGLSDWISGRRDFPFQKMLNVPNVLKLPFEEITIAEALRAHGYVTAAIGKWHLGNDPSSPEAHGFDHRVPHFNGGVARGFYAPFTFAKLDGPKDEYLTDRLAKEAVHFINDHKDQPFFLYLAHYSVHDPIQGRPDLVEKYEAKLAKMKPQSGPDFILEANPDARTPLTRQQLDQMIQQPEFAGYGVMPQGTVKIKQKQDNTHFAAMVESVDMSLGSILQALEKHNLTDNTLVVFYSDNGGMSGMNIGNPNRTVNNEQLDKAFSTSNLPMRGAKGWLYEGGIRVPLIVKWPGKGKAGITSDTPVTSTDMYPTMLEVAGLKPMPEQHVDGKSLAPILKGGEINRDAIYWHFPHYSNHGMEPPCGAVRAGDWKLIEYYENGTLQLFNLKNDLAELRDLATRESDKAAELRAMLHAWRDEVGAKMNEPNPDYDPTQYPSTPPAP
jgi:arylsulfatase A-like enzyme